MQKTLKTLRRRRYDTAQSKRPQTSVVSCLLQSFIDIYHLQTMHSLSSASSSTQGLQLLVDAAMILTPQPTLTQSKIPPVPSTPKKKPRRAKRCTAALPYIPPLMIDVGGGDKRKWLRLNHRACPKKSKKQVVKSLPFRLRQAKKKIDEELHLLWTYNNGSL